MDAKCPLVFCHNCEWRLPDNRDNSFLCELNPRFVPTYFAMNWSLAEKKFETQFIEPKGGEK